MKNLVSSEIDQKNKLIHGGMKGFVKIELASDDCSKTFIKNLQTKSPLLVQKALYSDSSKPKKAHIYLMSSAGGILQGDELEINITAGKNTETFVTTQAATKIYKAENQSSYQQINILLEKESYLEFLPKQIIPHKYAQYFQDVNLKIDNSSTLVYSETISAGRVAHGEKFDFNLVKMRLNCHNLDKKLLFSEAQNLEPENNSEVFLSLFGGKTLFSTVYIISPNLDSENIINKIHDLYERIPMIGYSLLPNNTGVLVRLLSDSIDEINNIISELAAQIADRMKFSDR